MRKSFGSTDKKDVQANNDKHYSQQVFIVCKGQELNLHP